MSKVPLEKRGGSQHLRGRGANGSVGRARLDVAPKSYQSGLLVKCRMNPKRQRTACGGWNTKAEYQVFREEMGQNSGCEGERGMYSET